MNLPASPNRQQTTAIAKYDFRTLSYAEAVSKIEELKAAELCHHEKARQLLQIVSSAFSHSESYRISLFDNWLLWLLSEISRDEFYSKALLDAQEASLLLRRGAGFCHQAALIYIDFANQLGLDAGLIRLNGHYVAEVRVEDTKWLVVDPDLGIFWDAPIEHFGSILGKAAIAERIKEQGFDADFSLHFASIYASAEDNLRISSIYSEKINSLIRISFKYIWTIPLVLLLVSFILFVSCAKFKTKV